ncbi:MAG: SpoIIE family protein phosphatase [candidate division KSB1 bacterium]|nr:SpoIIE family protein phosphatase [candidate division KSB1 bacterium]MDZ7272832.1 SpoIIE family protein phosphatase [candidate division KSB1 bacterium]MDZ7284145.1 SpoIIE family protein phosphatase [candidate division KSB1 bacterium]MDZ7297457.1 SpoIIE family protein phosphatase [candidate division KSB1 bacterium]MDZ7305593.1 SpoIIE family protein phosphatase [candidate division KSB1 bacterium]
MTLSFFAQLIYLMCGAVLFLLGFLIFREDSTRRLNRITAIMLFLAGLGPILGAFGLLLQQAGSPAEVDFTFLQRLYILWEFFFPQLVLFSLVFPLAHPVLTSHPRLPVWLFVPHAFHLLLSFALPDPSRLPALRQLLGLTPGWPALLQPLEMLLEGMLSLLACAAAHHETHFAALNILYVLAAVAFMQHSYQRLKNPRVRAQTRWVMWGILASLALYAIAFLLPKIFPFRVAPELAYVLAIACLLIGAGALAWAIIRYQFLDVRFLIRRSFVYSATSGLLVGAYLLIYNKARSAVNSVLGLNLPLVEVIFLLIAIIAFQPLLSLIESLVERWLFSATPDYQHFLQRLSRDLLSVMNPGQLQEKITHALRQALGAESVHLLLEDEQQQAFTTIIATNGRSEETHSEVSPTEVRFHREGQFVPLLARMESPVYADDLQPQISDAHEKEALTRLRSRLLLPLVRHGELVGILSVGAKPSRQPFSYEDMTLLTLLSNQATIAIENARLYQEKLQKQRLDEELNVAREIQRLLLPRQMPASPHFDLAAINLPSLEVGGDLYDFVTLPGDAIGVAIGDVAGKGVPGAILMANLLAVFRATAGRSLHPREVVANLNAQITRTTTPEKYATFCYAVLLPAENRLAYTNAGHNYPVLMRRDGLLVELCHSDLIVGVCEEAGYHEHRMTLAAGDALVFYTDGVTEAVNQGLQEFGKERLFEVIKAGRQDSAEGLRNRIYEAVLQFTGDMPQSDDLTLVVVRVK